VITLLFFFKETSSDIGVIFDAFSPKFITSIFYYNISVLIYHLSFRNIRLSNPACEKRKGGLFCWQSGYGFSIGFHGYHSSQGIHQAELHLEPACPLRGFSVQFSGKQFLINARAINRIHGDFFV